MAHPAPRQSTLTILQATAFAPLLLGYLVGSLPVLLPLLLHRFLRPDRAA